MSLSNWFRTKLNPENSKHQRLRQNFTVLIFLAFVILTLLGILNHAMWRDELNVWMITRDSHSWGELWEHIRYEGHPVLWYVCLYLLRPLTDNPIAMQLVHWLIAIAIAALILRFAPFSRLQKALLVFGYYPFYEYCLISRNYALGFLCLVLFCIAFSTRRRTYIPLSFILVLLANTNAFAMFLAVSLLGMLALEYCTDAKQRQLFVQKRGDLLLSSAIALTGLGASLGMLIPPPDANLAGGRDLTLTLEWNRLYQAMTAIWRAYIPILKPADRDSFPFAILSLGLWGGISLALLRKPLILVLNTIGTLLIVSFCYFKFLGVERHHGHLFLLLFACLWLSTRYPSHPQEKGWIAASADPLKGLRRGFSQAASACRANLNTFFTVVLVIHLVTGLVAFGRDLVLPYSASWETAQYIQAQNLDDELIVGSRDYAVSPIAGYLNRKFYYPEIQSMGSFVLFTTQRKEVELPAVILQLEQLIHQHPKLLLILNQELSSELWEESSHIRIQFLRSFTHSLIGSEKYYLYRVKAKSSAA